MKKILMLLGAAGMLFTACEPNEELYEQIEKQRDVLDGKVADVAFTLSDEDYGMTGDDAIKINLYFTSVDEAKQYIPVIMGEKAEFKNVGATSSAVVSYNLMHFDNAPYSLQSDYTLLPEDYDAMGGSIETYDNFSNIAEVFSFLAYKYPETEPGTTVRLTYNFRDNVYKKTEVRTTQFTFERGRWVPSIRLSKADYYELGQSYTNFDSYESAYSKLTSFINDTLVYALAEEQAAVIFTYTFVVKDGDNNVRKFEDRLLTFEHTGEKWAVIPFLTQQSMQLSFDGATWVPDNTIKYTLTDDDYKLVGNGVHFNFDIRTGKAEETLEARIAKINTILKQNFPDSEVDQKYLVTYKYYDGTRGTMDIHLILDGVSGTYIEVE